MLEREWNQVDRCLTIYRVIFIQWMCWYDDPLTHICVSLQSYSSNWNDQTLFHANTFCFNKIRYLSWLSRGQPASDGSQKAALLAVRLSANKMPTASSLDFSRILCCFACSLQHTSLDSLETPTWWNGAKSDWGAEKGLTVERTTENLWIWLYN